MGNNFTNSTFSTKRNYVYQKAYGEPKEYFKQVGAAIAQKQDNPQNLHMLDIGCATGHFLNYLATQFPRACFTGLDIDSDCLKTANKCNPGIDFVCGSVLDCHCFDKNSADIIILLGVHQCFDTLDEIVNNLDTWLKPNGQIYIAGGFNPYGVDTLLRFRRTQTGDDYSMGLNFLSKQTVAKLFENKGYSCTFENCNMPFDIAPDSNDLIRSWTVHNEHGHKMHMNGTGLLFNMELMTAIRKQG